VSKLLSVQNLSIGYGKKILQEGLNFNISVGGILFVRGRNGAGKSTLIKTLCGERKSLAGRIDWKINKREVAVLPQLVSHEFPLSVTLGEILDSFELSREVSNLIPSELKDRRFNDASGGEKQKALILTRLRKGISFLILDEPFNHMDKKAIKEVLDFLSILIKQKIIKGMVLISHVSVDFQEHDLSEVQLI